MNCFILITHREEAVVKQAYLFNADILPMGPQASLQMSVDRLFWNKMNIGDKQIYIIGYGNRFRQDDGLGPEMIDMLRADSIDGVILDDTFQISFDDAYNISESKSDLVIFIDATVNGNGKNIFFNPADVS